MAENLTPDAEALRSEFLRLAAAAPLWRETATPAVYMPPEEDESGDEAEDPPARRRNGEQSEPRGAPRLLALLDGETLHVDPYGGTYIDLDGDVIPLDPKNSLLFENISSLYYRATGQTIGRDSLGAAVAVLSYKARREGRVAPMANRAHFDGDTLYYDLGNGRAVRLAGGAWEVVPAPVGYFRTWTHKRPHPEPLSNGNAWRVFRLVHVAKDDQPLVLATLAACLVPRIARPALVITGSQGSGKSTAARFFKMLLDPGHPALTMIPRKPEDLDLLLERYFFLALDNISNLAPDIADTLSGVITGAAPQRRRLHTDNELMTLHADVTICFTSINSLSDRPDFMERTLRIQLERIEDTDRLADDELDSAFADELPGILGGLLSLLANGLEILPTYRPPRLPRMAAFARIAAAIAEGIESGAGERYLAEFFKNQGAQHMELAEGNLFFSAILEACAAGEPPCGTFKDVVTALKEIADPGPKDPFPTARGFARALERLRVPLTTAGIGFEIDRRRTSAGKAFIRFFEIAKPGEPKPEQGTAQDSDVMRSIATSIFGEGDNTRG